MAEIQQCLQSKSQFVLQVSGFSPPSHLELELQSLWTACLYCRAKWNLQGAQKEFWASWWFRVCVCASWWFRHSCSTNTIVVLHSTDKISFTDCYPTLLWWATSRDWNCNVHPCHNQVTARTCRHRVTCHQRTLGSANKTKNSVQFDVFMPSANSSEGRHAMPAASTSQKQCSMIASSECAKRNERIQKDQNL